MNPQKNLYCSNCKKIYRTNSIEIAKQKELFCNCKAKEKRIKEFFKMKTQTEELKQIKEVVA